MKLFKLEFKTKLKKCAQCKGSIPFGEPFIKAEDYYYHLQCAGLLIEVFQKAADNNGGNIIVGGEAVEHLRASDMCKCGDSPTHTLLSGKVVCEYCGRTRA